MSRIGGACQLRCWSCLMPSAIELMLPRRIYVEGTRVYADMPDGRLLVMNPEVAVALGKLFSDAGTEALIAKFSGGSQPPT